MMEVNVGLVLFLLSILGYLYHLLTRNNDYFHEKPIPSMAVKPIFGSTGSLILKRCTWPDFVVEIYNKYANTKVFGMFDSVTPIFVVQDPELIKKITIKDFDHFVDHRPMFGDSRNDSPYTLFGKSLFAMNGSKWRSTRATLSPAFTGSKMRQMFELMIDCCESATKYLEGQVQSAKDMNMSDLASRLGTDMIASCAFGIQIDSLRNPENEFYSRGKEMINFERISVVFKMFGFKLCPKLMGRLGIDLIDRKPGQYFSALIRQAINDRLSKGVIRYDMIHLLLQAKQGVLRHQQESEQYEGFAVVQESHVGKQQATEGLTENEMIAQTFVFFLAGFETVATSLSFVVHDLVVHEDIQQKLYEEIVATHEALAGKKLNYDTLQRMEYMDMVISESMRMRPAAILLDRCCTHDYQVDDGEGLRFTIDKGTVVWIPTQGIHMDPKYYPNPYHFDPERFSAENRHNIDPLTYLPFGIGPRNCIGSRFALMEIKVVLYYLLLSYKFQRSERTEIPLKMRKGQTILAVESPLIVKFAKR
ncbi:probable cytochrome P450 9f2 [Uranotaenia lowii]|uniref:probable cytochrome P450 9f2 n=1 Tax=Uranotaenia lowii TaxID=190385 RepID=UPI002479FD9A|nr:probable cytochrome P450 9f2 [Uranotaenia lowii]